MSPSNKSRKNSPAKKFFTVNINKLSNISFFFR